MIFDSPVQYEQEVEQQEEIQHSRSLSSAGRGWGWQTGRERSSGTSEQWRELLNNLDHTLFIQIKRLRLNLN